MLEFVNELFKGKTMNAKTISRLASQLRVAAQAAGMEPGDVIWGPESAGIVGTGVDITWSDDARGRGKNGWQVRTTYHVTDVGSPPPGRIATDIIAIYSPHEEYQAVRQAVLAVVQRRIEAALETLA